MPPRSILHVDMDQFYAAVEMRDDPRLRDRPVVVGSDPRGGKGRGVVSTSNYIARRFGIHSAMPVSQAYKLCPTAVFIEPRMDAYVAESEVIHQVFDELTPLVEPLSLDEAFLDVTASRLLFGDGPACARWIQEQVTLRTRGLTCSVGVAANKYVAKVASDLKKPGGLVVVPAGQEADFLAPLSVRHLWGVGPAAETVLTKLGLKTVGQVAGASFANLRAALGEDLASHYQALARGLDERPVISEREAKSIGRETTFDSDTRDLGLLRATLADLSADVAQRLRRNASLAGTLALKYRWEGFETHTAQRALDPPSAHGPDLFAAGWDLLRQQLKKEPRKVRLIGLSANQLLPANAGVQESLFEKPSQKKKDLDAALDAVAQRHGDDLLKRANQSGIKGAKRVPHRTGFS